MKRWRQREDRGTADRFQRFSALFDPAFNVMVLPAADLFDGQPCVHLQYPYADAHAYTCIRRELPDGPLTVRACKRAMKEGTCVLIQAEGDRDPPFYRSCAFGLVPHPAKTFPIDDRLRFLCKCDRRLLQAAERRADPTEDCQLPLHGRHPQPAADERSALQLGTGTGTGLSGRSAGKAHEGYAEGGLAERKCCH